MFDAVMGWVTNSHNLSYDRSPTIYTYIRANKHGLTSIIHMNTKEVASKLSESIISMKKKINENK